MASSRRPRGSGEYDPNGPFVCIGRLLPYKGVDVFVRALEILMQRGEAVTAVIGGEGVTTRSRRRVSPVWRSARADQRRVVRRAIDRCAAVVLPYRNATQSGVLAHAFVAGRPVIATNVGSFPDYVDGDNGFLVPPATRWRSRRRSRRSTGTRRRRADSRRVPGEPGRSGSIPMQRHDGSSMRSRSDRLIDGALWAVFFASIALTLF